MKRKRRNLRHGPSLAVETELSGALHSFQTTRSDAARKRARRMLLAFLRAGGTLRLMGTTGD